MAAGFFMTRILTAAAVLAALAGPARAQSNVSPLAFGMTPQEVAAALGSPLAYVSGRPGNEVLSAVYDAGIPWFYPSEERIVLQFRRGRLTGWKRDWVVRGPFRLF